MDKVLRSGGDDGGGDFGSCTFFLRLDSGFFLAAPGSLASETAFGAVADWRELFRPTFSFVFALWEDAALFFVPGLAAIEKQEVFKMSLRWVGKLKGKGIKSGTPHRAAGVPTGG